MNMILNYIETRKMLIKRIESKIIPLYSRFDCFDNIIVECMGQPYLVDSITTFKDNTVIIITKNGAALSIELLSLQDLNQILELWNTNKSKKKLSM